MRRVPKSRERPEERGDREARASTLRGGGGGKTAYWWYGASRAAGAEAAFAAEGDESFEAGCLTVIAPATWAERPRYGLVHVRDFDFLEHDGK